MKDRPQHTNGEAGVVFLIICGREVGDDARELALLDCPGVDLCVDQGRPAPTEPDAAIVLEQPAHSDRKTSGIIGAVVARNRDAIRHHYQPRQISILPVALQPHATDLASYRNR